MFSLTIYFGTANTPLILLFKGEEKARELYDSYVSVYETDGLAGAAIAVDDFGQAIAIPFAEITGMLLDDMDLSQRAYIERGLHNARAQAKAQQLAAADPTIRSAAQGPAVMSPFAGVGQGPRFNG